MMSPVAGERSTLRWMPDSLMRRQQAVEERIARGGGFQGKDRDSNQVRGQAYVQMPCVARVVVRALCWYPYVWVRWN